MNLPEYVREIEHAYSTYDEGLAKANDAYHASLNSLAGDLHRRLSEARVAFMGDPEDKRGIIQTDIGPVEAMPLRRDRK